MFSSSAEAKAVLNALIPDNVNFPKGLSMRMFSSGSALRIEITGISIPIATIVNTLDEVLAYVYMSKKVMTN